MNAITLNIQALASLTHEQFFQLCQDNRDLRLERTAEGELIIMPPTGWISGFNNDRYSLHPLHPCSLCVWCGATFS